MTRLPLRVLVPSLTVALGLGLTAPAAAAPDHPGPPTIPGAPRPGTLAMPDIQTPARPYDQAPQAAVTWRLCKGLLQFDAKCAMVPVPLDHDDPTGPTIRLAVSRVRHTVPDSKYQGAILVNPGGPGGSGLVFSLIRAAFPAKVRRAYDWIGFDPRGVGSSRPALSCDTDYFGFDRPDYLPRPKANKKAWRKRARQYAKDCRANGDILRHMTTVDNAMDMEALRMALGEPRINYYGFSYGTYLGQVYATLFPDRVRRLVFDSNVNPRDVFYQSNLKQSVAIDRVFRRWFRWIADEQRAYQLGGSRAAVQDRFTAAQDALRRRPAAGKIGPSEWIDLFLPVAYRSSEWPGLARVWAKYEHQGKTRPLVQAYKSAAAVGDDNSYAVYNAVQCTDAPWPTQWSTWSKDNWRIYDKAPLATWMNVWFNAPCLTWPVSPRARFYVEGDDVRGGPLLVGGTLDAATPFANSKAVKRLFPRSRLVAIEGETTHAASLDGNRCVMRVVSRYLSTGALPNRRPGKQPDVRCRRGPLPDAIPSARGLG